MALNMDSFTSLRRRGNCVNLCNLKLMENHWAMLVYVVDCSLYNPDSIEIQRKWIVAQETHLGDPLLVNVAPSPIDKAEYIDCYINAFSQQHPS